MSTQKGNAGFWTGAIVLVAVVLGLSIVAFLQAGDVDAVDVARTTPTPAAAASASGTATAPATTAAGGPEVVIEMKGMQFGPKEVRIAPGTTVIFTNQDPVEHNVVNATAATLGKAPELFRSPELRPGESWQWTFTEEGTYDILCDIGGHYLAGMVGKIIVTADAAVDTAAGASAAVTASAPRIAKDPTDLPPPVGRREPELVVFELETTELVGQLADGMTYEYWTFNDTVPGPLLRARVGDTIEIRLRNNENSTQVHSIDLHAVNGPGGGADVTQVAPGEEKAFRFKALSPGVFVYHCATPYVPLHVTNGMYGLIVIEPEEGYAPVDREFYVMQGDIYTDLRPGESGHAVHDPEAMWNEIPNFVVFNGQFQALTGEHAMKANVGERVRIFVGNGGPNLSSSFHVIGEIFEVVHPEGAAEALSHVQTTTVAPGGATFVEFTVDVPGDYVLVDHALGRALGKGAVAILEVDGPENPEVFRTVD